MRAVLFGFLRHQADVADIAHRGHIKCAMLFAKLNNDVVDAGIAAIRNHCPGVGQLAIRAPHLTGGANRRRHRRVDNDIAGYVQVGDALVRIDHR